MMRLRTALCLTALLASMALTSTGAMAQTVTGYREMMKNVYSPVCLQCHNSPLTGSSRNGAPSTVNFDTYTLAYVSGDAGNTRVQAGTMPPSSADSTLSATGKTTYQAWVDGGKQVGTVVDYDDMREQVFVPVCLNCHDSNKSGSARNGAPSDVNFDTFDAARTKATRGNLRAQAGTMPPSGALNATRKAAFQDWVWLDTPSGTVVSYATLKDSLLSNSCITCHSNFGIYADAVTNAAKINNRMQTATTSPHGPQTQAVKDLVFNWVYAGTPENDPATGPVCDLDGNGTVESADVIWLILYYRNNAFDNLYDLNSDGKYSISDAIKLVINIREGVCRDAGSLLASADSYVAPEWLSNLSADDVAYVESMLELLGLSSDEEAAVRAALHGQTGAPSLPRAFSLAQNSPNPFNPLTTISYTVPDGESAQVRLEVFDISGRLVTTLVDQFKSAGTYSVFWNGSNSSGAQVSSGVYFYRMTAGGFSSTRKMVLLK